MDINILVNTIVLTILIVFYCLFILYINKKEQIKDKKFLLKFVFINPNKKKYWCILLNLLFWLISILSLIFNILFLTNILSLKSLIIAFNSLTLCLFSLNLLIFAKTYL